MELTEKLGLKKPDLTDYVNIGDLNDNMDILDGEVGELKEGTTVIEDLETDNKTLSGAINEIKTEVDAHKTETMPISGGTFTGIAKAHPNTSNTVAQIRNIILSPNDAVVGSMSDGDIWIKYE